MSNFRALIAVAAAGSLVVFVSVGIFLAPSLVDSTLPFIALAIWMTGTSFLGAGAAAKACSRFETKRYGFIALALQGTIAGLAVSIVTLFIPMMVQLGDAIWIWPAVIGLPVGAATVIASHLRFNRT